MATDLESKAVPKYESFVDSQLARVRTRIRALDAGRSLMMLAVLSLAYFLAMALFDLAVKGDDDPAFTAVRLAAFGLYVLLMLGFLAQLGLRLYRRINPYFAAKQLEETIPDAKNSVINWLDLKEKPLPGAIRNAVGLRAARELKQTDPDKAVNPKGNWLLGGILAGLLLGLVVLFALGPNQFGSLVQRAFAPFRTGSLANRAEITLIKPTGDIAIPTGQRVDFQTRIDGRFPKLGQPGAPRFLYRYQQADPFVALPLDEGLDGIWNALLLADQVQNGFWWKIVAGDAETPEYQVKVQSLPQATKFQVTYHYRPYRKLADDVVTFPNETAVLPRIKDYRGTEVTLLVRTNRALKWGAVELDMGGGNKEQILGTVLPGDARAVEVKWTLERRGNFRILFTSKEDEANTDRSPYPMEVLDDETPRVVLTKPAQDVELPAGGTLQLEGNARDDIGIKSMAVRLKVLEGPMADLAPKVYREGKSFQFDDGTYPDALDYKDFVALDTVKTAKGQPFPLKTGMLLEYWLEAADNSDYPNKNGNVGKSIAYKLKITEDAKQDKKKQQEERKSAEKEQQKHEQQQDKKNAKENQKRNDTQGNNDPQKQKEDEKRKQDFENKAKDLEKQLKQKEREEQDKGQAKGQDQKPAENKPGEKNDKADQKDAANPGQAGEKKDEGKPGQKDQPANAKDQGPKQRDEKKPSEAKGPGEQKADPAQAKEGSGAGQDGPKSEKKDGGQGDVAQAKEKGDKGDKGGKPEPEAGKDGPPPQNPPQGVAKGDEGDSKGDAKGAPMNPQVGKKDGNGKGPDAPASKGTDPGQAKDSAQAKDDNRKADEDGLKNAKAPKTGPKTGPEPMVKDGKGPQGDPSDGAGKKGEAKEPQEIAKGGEPVDSNCVKGGEPDPQGKGQVKKGPSSNVGPGGKGLIDDLTKQDPNADFAKRGGELQLEDLKKRLTPEAVKKLGWTEQQWQQFQKDVRAYEDLLRRQQSQARTGNQKGAASPLGSQKLRQVDLAPGDTIDPAQAGRVLPPPEFRDAQRQFTNPRKN